MHEIIQGTDEWHQIRAGKVTASKIADVTAKGRSGAPSKTRATYMGQLIAERLTGNPTEGFSNSAMEWGTETEDEARAAYSFYRDVKIEQVGFVDHANIDMSGASPDGLVGLDGLVEFKCPNTATHIDTILGKPTAGNYIKQMQWQMSCTDREWCDYASYDPRMPEHLRLHVTRVERDDGLITEFDMAVIDFIFEMEAKIETLNKLSEVA